MAPSGSDTPEYPPEEPARKAERFPSRPGGANLVGMSDAFLIPPLPSSWPYTPRGAGGAPERVAGADLPALGSGWTLFLREPLPADAEAGAMPEAFGRGGILRIRDIVVRPYRRGGLVRHLNAKVYSSPARFAREFAVHWALWAAGFPTVEPLGYGFRRCLWGVEGVFLTRYAEAVPWPSRWERSAEVLPRLSELLGALCAWGLHAPDLNATNVLLASDGRVLALDWDRASWMAGEDLLPRYRSRLLRSLQKLGAPPAAMHGI